MTALLTRDEFLEKVALIDSVATVEAPTGEWHWSVEENQIRVNAGGVELAVAEEGLVAGLQKVPGLTKAAVQQWPVEMLINTTNWFYEHGEGDARGLVHNNVLIGFTKSPDSPIYPVSQIVETMTAALPDDEYLFGNVRVSLDQVTFGLVTPARTSEPKVGDVVQAGIWALHSPTARRNPEISPFVNRLVCTNGMISSRSLSKWSWKGNADYIDWVTESTGYAWNSLDLEFESLEALTHQALNGHASVVLEDLFDRHRVPSNLRAGVLDAVVDEADGTMYGIAQAFNRAANEIDNPAAMRGLLMVTGDIAAQDERCENCFRYM